MGKYELTIVLDGKVSPAKKKKITETVEKLVAVSKGKLGKVEDWGEKELAYKIGKSETGFFTYFELELDPGGVKGLNDKLRTDADVIRYLLIRKNTLQERLLSMPSLNLIKLILV